jgi:hypothetical protein
MKKVMIAGVLLVSALLNTGLSEIAKSGLPGNGI